MAPRCLELLAQYANGPRDLDELGHNSVDFSINQCNVCHSELAGYRNSVLFDMDTVNS